MHTGQSHFRGSVLGAARRADDDLCFGCACSSARRVVDQSSFFFSRGLIVPFHGRDSDVHLTTSGRRVRWPFVSHSIDNSINAAHWNIAGT
jgi:hypothetical protein